MYTLRSTLGGRVLGLLRSPTLRNCPCIIQTYWMFRISYSIGRRLQTRGNARNDAEKRREVLQPFFEVSLRGKGEATTTVEVVMTIMSIERDPFDLK